MIEATSDVVAQRPAPVLAPLIDRYVGYRLTGFPPGLHRRLPSPQMTFIVAIGEPIDVVTQTDPGQAPRRYRCVLSGLQASTALIAHDGNQEGVAIELTPLGFRGLFGLPARALWNTSVELSEVVRRAGDELCERVESAQGWPERFRACDEVLGHLARRTRPDRATTAPEVRRAWSLLERSHGSVSITDLARDVGWSRQHLGRRFRDEIGMLPKLAARVMRFDRARHALAATARGATVADVAASCGYYDQPHMAREFAELAGCAPLDVLDDVPSVHDTLEPSASR